MFSLGSTEPSYGIPPKLVIPNILLLDRAVGTMSKNDDDGMSYAGCWKAVVDCWCAKRTPCGLWYVLY